jgi:hypothetical protein
MIHNFLNKKHSLSNLSDKEFENIVGKLSSELEQNGFIYDSYENSILLKDFQSLCKKDVNNITNINATSTVGMKIIKNFMHHFYDVQNHKKVSVHSLWKKDNLEKALRFNRKYHSTPYVSEIIRSLSFTNGLGKITIYRPLMAKMVVNHFKVKSVLDISIGWGGRLLGTKSVDENISYTGFEPCLKTYNSLCNIKSLLHLQNVNIINKPSEIGLLELPLDIKFDMALTSPPYYNLEIYSDEKTQSHTYGNYENWIDKFLRPVIDNVLLRVKYSCWSVKNFKSDKQYNLFDDITKIHNENGWVILDIMFSMNNSKRPGASSDIKKSEEKTYVFVKKNI